MRVLMDGSHLQTLRGTGVATYTRGLAGLVRAAGMEVDVVYGRRWSGGDDELLREVEFYDARPTVQNESWKRRLRESLGLLSAFREARPRRVPGRGVLTRGWSQDVRLADRQWNRANLFRLAAARQRLTGGFLPVSNQEIQADFAHWAYPLPLRLKGVPNVVTIHDLVPLRLPYTTLDRKREYLRLVRGVAATADLIVTVSETSKRDLIELLGVDENRVVNTYQPVEVAPQKDKDIEGNEGREGGEGGGGGGGGGGAVWIGGGSLCVGVRGGGAEEEFRPTDRGVSRGGPRGAVSDCRAPGLAG